MGTILSLHGNLATAEFSLGTVLVDTGQMLGIAFRRDIRNQFVVFRLGRQCVQETANVDLIPREVAADGVSINGKTHLTDTSIAKRNATSLCQKSNFAQAVSHVNSFSINSLPAERTLSLNSVHSSSLVTESAKASGSSASNRCSPS